MIWTPDTPGFYDILHSNLPPRFGACSTTTFVVCADTGLLTPATDEELIEYINGGEYDEALSLWGDDDVES